MATQQYYNPHQHNQQFAPAQNGVYAQQYQQQQQQQPQQQPQQQYSHHRQHSTYIGTSTSQLNMAQTTPYTPHPSATMTPQHQQQPPYQQYNHYNTYQPGPPSEMEFQRQQYHQMQQQQQQQQQQLQQNGGRPSSTLPALNSLRDWFDAVDTDRSGGLSCEELQRALVNGDGWTPFNMETVRMMMNMFDRDGNGTISFNEFIGLWNYIEKWKTCFQAYDLDGSGTIDASELQKALRGFGYNLSEATVALIMTKYDVRGRGDISFDNFVQSCVTVQTLTDSFRRIDVTGTGIVTMTYEQFLGLVISNR
ncbi:Programmed cell death protein 6 [Entomortierella chlamydospora]|uniref:Programmed cell death protein 6 n=1 Tax=Entomortierella chlamydospora TaxID=101097 RepID=A0A9P6T419_9FUNG|nr:Programmed cell death protein 6 [Entomortierella chlamydospora]KAG0023367.1 Programmed cell death protein 6 [Entomortierella chlamydospora]